MKKKKLYLIVVGILLVIALLTGVSYALWTKTFTQTGNNTVASDCFNISFLEDTTSNIKLENTFPIRDNEGMNLKPYTFSVTNKCSNEVSYEINLETTTNTTMKDSYVKVMMGENTPRLLTTYVSGNKILSNGKSSYVLESGNLTGNTTNNYKIRIWMDENVTQNMENAMNSTFESKITVTGTYIKNYHESILNGTDPVLKDNLIPVTIENDGTVKKADIRKEWYSYQNKNWANAVITKDSYTMLNESGKVINAKKEENAVFLDGINHAVNFDFANYDFQNQVTISINFLITEHLPYQIILGNQEGSGIAIEIFDKKLSFAPFVNDTYRNLISANDLELNHYYQAVFVYDGTEQRMYLDGELVGKQSLSGNIKTSPMPFVLGANPEYDSNHNMIFVTDSTQKKIQDVAIYNKSYNDEEIKSDFVNTPRKPNSETVFNYDFKKNEYSENDIIPESNIESYFVWIPRYKYQIFNDGNYPGLTTVENRMQEINVIFENKNTTPSNGSTVGSWLTHPAFISFDTNGMWVGKYETGNKGATTTGEAQKNVNDSTKLQIKPNVYSWRNIQVSNAHLNSYNYQRNLDSHMMKNTEWGAVAYLQHSNFGSKQSVRMNNNSNYITGYSALNEPTCGYTNSNETCNQYGTSSDITQPYNSETGYLASTTGNISGVYDMSGGSWEYVMGVMKDKTGNLISGKNSINNSGFNGTFGCPTCDNDTSGKTELTTGINYPDSKYYDTYAYAENDQNYQRRILGDATGEMGPFGTTTSLTLTKIITSWHGDDALFVYHVFPFFARSGAFFDGKGTGIFDFIRKHGNIQGDSSFRIVLAI